MASAIQLILVVGALVTTVKGATNSTDTYTEPEEINDSIPVAITILVILILLVLIFIIILLIVCIRLMNRSSRKKDIEEDTRMTTYNRQEQPVRHEQPPHSTHDPHQRPHPQEGKPPQVVYVATAQQQQQPPPAQQGYGYAGGQSPPTVQPDQNCQCEACQEIRRARQEGRAPRI